MSKSLEELKNDAVIDYGYKDSTDDCTYSCNEKSAFIDGWYSAIKAIKTIDKESTWDRERIDAGHEQVVFELKEKIKAVSEREKTINEKEIVDIITEWKHFWMNQTQNNQQDYENYFRRASGVDANMKYNLAKRICEALKDYRGMK